MKWTLSVRAKANADLQNAQDWYELQEKGLGDAFRTAVNDAFDVIEQNPRVCQLYHKKFRQFLPERFPYRILYFIDGGRSLFPECFTHRRTSHGIFE